MLLSLSGPLCECHFGCTASRILIVISEYCSREESCRFGTQESGTQKVGKILSALHLYTHSLAEKTLVTLHKQRSERIEEIKKKTNYYTTRNLLERYDDSPSTARASPKAPNSPLSPQQQQQHPMVKAPAQGTPPQQTPQRPTSKSSLARMCSPSLKLTI